MSALAEYLKNHIAAHGPMDVGQFMALALGHPQHGYYMKKDPFGAGGDFTTAPEISQIFGEVLGAWVADIWAQMGRPDPFVLLECGPGRGTLMADMMRATSGVLGFHAACRIHLLEMSPVLKSLQREMLADFNVIWHESLSTHFFNCPFIIIANEFLDALPVRQMQKTKEGWQERLISHSEEKAFHFIHGSAMQGDFPAAGPDAIFEVSPARVSFMRHVTDLLVQAGGVALFIDYGHVQSAPGDTLQAVYKHHYVSIFEHIGDADLTSHVDFEALQAAAGMVNIYGPVEQGAFLRALGIEQRAAYLMKKSDRKQKDEIEKALHRLTHSSQMGSLFKVMGISHGHAIQPAGF